MPHLAVLYLHMTQIVFVVSKGGLTLGAGPLCLSSGLSAAPRRGRVISGSLVVLVRIIVVVIFLLLFFFLLLLPPPVLSVRILRFSGRLGFEARGAGCVGRG